MSRLPPVPPLALIEGCAEVHACMPMLILHQIELLSEMSENRALTQSLQRDSCQKYISSTHTG